MKNWNIYLFILACGLCAGCHSARSISNPGHRPGGRYVGSDPAFDYRGELSEFDVLGIARGEITSDAEIQRALDAAKSVKLRPDSSVLLIQSGALFPDGPMVAELGKHARVVPFSGVPPLRKTGVVQTESPDPESYAKSLRLTAARSGSEMIICYWGLLESESEHLPTRTVSWMPGVNWLLPDQLQHMRIRLKLALVDVRTGNWTVFTPKSFDDQRLSLRPRRGAVDQHQVDRLKQTAYVNGVKELVGSYSDLALAR